MATKKTVVKKTAKKAVVKKPRAPRSPRVVPETPSVETGSFGNHHTKTLGNRRSKYFGSHRKLTNV